jgi:hypothetical protein
MEADLDLVRKAQGRQVRRSQDEAVFGLLVWSPDWNEDAIRPAEVVSMSDLAGPVR